jgi:AcrR family transcriptional regulator
MAARVRTRVDPRLRRQLILDEAIHLIGQLGYHGLTVQELAKRCGLTNGGLLHYFGSKELLLVAILEERDRREGEFLAADIQFERETTGEAEYAWGTVMQMFRAIMARSVAQPELVRLVIVLQSEALHPAHPAHDYFVRREAMILGEFARLLVGHVADPRATAREVLALLEGLFQQWLRAERSFDLLDAWDHAAAALTPINAAPPIAP